MKILLLLLTVFVCLSAFSGDAFAVKIGYNGRTTTSHEHASCKTLRTMCLAHHGDATCKILYDAAIKEGGNWATPAAQAAAKVDETKTDIGTKNVGCHVD
jgi:hypothetical protein